MGRLAMLLICGCAVEAGDGLAGGLGALPGLAGEGESSDGGGASESEADATTTMLEAGTSSTTTDGTSSEGTGGTFTPLDDGSTAGDSSSSSSGGAADEPVDPQPAAGMFSHCTSVTMCAVGLGCFRNPAHTDGFCSRLCEGDASSCGNAPAGTSLTCTLSAEGDSVCAIDCADDQPCPGGMACLPEAICM